MATTLPVRPGADALLVLDEVVGVALVVLLVLAELDVLLVLVALVAVLAASGGRVVAAAVEALLCVVLVFVAVFGGLVTGVRGMRVWELSGPAEDSRGTVTRAAVVPGVTALTAVPEVVEDGDVTGSPTALPQAARSRTAMP